MMTPIFCRLFLAIDEWLWVFFSSFLFFRWVRARMNMIMFVDTGASLSRDANIFRERALRWAFLTVFVVGAIMVYGIAYPMYYNLSNEHPAWWIR